MKLWYDSKSAINITNNLVQHDRTKHVNIDRFFIKEKLESGLFELESCGYGKSNSSLPHQRT
jgi:hypothetical protein